MRTILHIILFLVTLNLQAQINRQKKHLVRITQLKPIVELYDSIVQASGWFKIQTYHNENNCIYYFTENNRKTECRCGDSIPPHVSVVKYPIYQRLFRSMQANGVWEIASVTWPSFDEYRIELVFKINRLTGVKHAYVFAMGKTAIAEAKKNRRDKEISENIYLSKFKDH